MILEYQGSMKVKVDNYEPAMNFLWILVAVDVIIILYYHINTFVKNWGHYLGWVLPYLDMVGRFRGDDPHFGDSQFNWVPILYLNTIRMTPCFCRKISLPLSHLVSEILGPKVGLIFHQNVLLNRFEAFSINFLLDFWPNWPPFSLILNWLDPSISQNLKSDWVLFFIHMLNLATEKLMEYPPPPPPPGGGGGCSGIFNYLKINILESNQDLGSP